MTPNANIDIFRKHYEDMIDCKNAINTNAETLNSNEENAIEALIPIINEYGREMVKKLVVNAVLQNRQNYNEHIRKWADNAIIAHLYLRRIMCCPTIFLTTYRKRRLNELRKI